MESECDRAPWGCVRGREGGWQRESEMGIAIDNEDGEELRSRCGRRRQTKSQKAKEPKSQRAKEPKSQRAKEREREGQRPSAKETKSQRLRVRKRVSKRNRGRRSRDASHKQYGGQDTAQNMEELLSGARAREGASKGEKEKKKRVRQGRAACLLNAGRRVGIAVAGKNGKVKARAHEPRRSRWCLVSHLPCKPRFSASEAWPGFGG